MNETMVRTYKARDQQAAAKAYSDEANALAGDAWIPVSQSWAEGRSGCLRVIALGFIGALVIKPKGSLSVTYIRGSR